MTRPGRTFFQTAARKNRAGLQFVFGQLQIIGATAGLVLLLTAGVRKPTVIVAGLTFVIMLVSRLIFHEGKTRDTKL